MRLTGFKVSFDLEFSEGDRLAVTRFIEALTPEIAIARASMSLGRSRATRSSTIVSVICRREERHTTLQSR